jgi:hypothetical protein
MPCPYYINCGCQVCVFCKAALDALKLGLRRAVLGRNVLAGRARPASIARIYGKYLTTTPSLFVF